MRIIADMGRFADEVLARISRAHRRVDVECFIVRDDQLGRALASALADAAARGVPCRLLYDPLGCQRTPGPFFRALAARSIAFAIEVAVVSHDPAHALAAEDQMRKDLAASSPVDEARLRQIGFVRRLGNYLASLLMKTANVLVPRQPALLPPSRAS